MLLALAREPLHGYAIVQRMEEDSDGRVKILPGNLYTVLRRLEEAELVRESRKGPAPDEDQRRRYFELTATGHKALRDESVHLERLVKRLRSASLRPAKGEARG